MASKLYSAILTKRLKSECETNKFLPEFKLHLETKLKCEQLKHIRVRKRKKQ